MRTKTDGGAASAGANLAARRQAPLAMDAEAFRAAGHRLVDRVSDLLASVPERPVTRGEAPSGVRAALDLNGSLPEDGCDPEALLTTTAGLLFDHSLFNGHPRFFGYITSPPAPVGILGEMLAAAVNANAGAWILAPAATEIETQTIRWIAELIGYPASAGGILVSGGNMANFVGFFAARAAQAPWPVREKGAAGGPPLRAYGSAETHTWIQKAADLAGLGTESVRWIETDGAMRMRVDALRRKIREDRERGDVPFLVVGTAGSVGTGAVDPLPEIAALCREEKVWFHVDGAYGGLAAAVPEAPEDLRGLALADSVAVDPHKWLYAPIEAGCALVRDPARLRAAFAYHPPYYRFGEEGLNYVEYGPQNSRGFRALKVWLALRHAGARGYRAMIAEDMRLSRVMAERVGAEPDLERFTQSLSITTFRFLPRDLRERRGESDVAEYLDRLNQDLLDRIQNGGECFVSNAVIGGRYVLRACIVNFHTGEADVAAVPVIVARVGREVDAALRPASLRAARS